MAQAVARRVLSGEIFGPGSDIPEAPSDDDGLLDVADLVRKFEESEESTYQARVASEKDWDFYDGIQYSADELAEMAKRGQPPVKTNLIKPKIDFLVGVEKSQRIDPRAMPRTPQHEEDADAASKALKYVSDEQLYDDKRSEAWKDMLVKGAAGINVQIEEKQYGPSGPELCIKLEQVPWDRMFYDPHSAKHDFTDAAYLGVVTWMDYDEAVDRYIDVNPEVEDILDATIDSANISDTYDDKPKFNLWADKKRKRVRICEIWIKRGDAWHFAEYTKGGILVAGPSPFQTDQGESDCALFFASAYVDRDNNRYGIVRDLVPLQEEVNKRRSKALHLLNTAQVVMKEGTLSGLNDLERVRREAAKPDGIIIIAETGSPINDGFQFNTRTDLAAGQVQLLQESKNELDKIGPNATMMGEKAQGSASASGRAIIASQQGGMMQLRDLLDKLTHLDKRVFRAIWNRIRQFWTGEKWIRITDDERNIRWVGINVDPQMIQMAMQANPQMQDKIAGLVGNVAELDCDIIIDEAPDSVTPALEQWQALIELEKTRPGSLPLDVLISSAPNLKNKADILKTIKEAQQNQGPPPEVQKMQAELQMKQQGMQMDMQGKQAELQLKQQGQAAEMQMDGAKAERDAVLEQQKMQQEMALREQEAVHNMQLAEMEARNKMEIARVTAAQQAAIGAQKAQADVETKNFTSRAQEARAGREEKRAAKQSEQKELDLGEVMKLMAAIDKKLSTPKKKKVVRDGKGRISHVEESRE